TIPVQMKKNRPGILLTCICRPEDKDKFTGLFFLHTSTRGVRYQTFPRAKLESTFETRPTAYGDIRIKKSSGYGIEKEKPEFEDLKSVVLKNGCSLSLAEVTKALLH
ncbi:MAG: nickel insertion protein, partial [Acetatifactor sp.]